MSFFTKLICEENCEEPVKEFCEEPFHKKNTIILSSFCNNPFKKNNFSHFSNLKFIAYSSINEKRLNQTKKKNFFFHYQTKFIKMALVPLKILTYSSEIGDKTQEITEGFVGTKGQNLFLQGFCISFAVLVEGIGLEYMAVSRGMGQSSWVPAGTFLGTRAQHRPLEGFAIRLTGPNAQHFKVVYYGQ
jgi:hypothetical protein